jgi:hypothetical protein
MLTNNTYIDTVNTPESFSVFATEDIKQGAIVEEFIFRQSPWRELELDSRAVFFHNTALLAHCPCNFCRQYGAPFVMPAGNVSTYTHNSNPNAEVHLPDEGTVIPTNGMLVGGITALRDIAKGDMVTINYTLNYSTKKLPPEIVIANETATRERAAKAAEEAAQEIEV